VGWGKVVFEHKRNIFETRKILWRAPIAVISGTGNATNFKFCRCIYRVDRNKSPINNFRKSSRGSNQGLHSRSFYATHI